MKTQNFLDGSLLLSNQTLPFVSVIVIVLNMDKTIGSCLSALEKVDFPRHLFEIIVVDGGSTDKTLDIVKKFDVKLLKEDRRIRGFARNYGIKHCKGSIIAFIDSDCIASKEWLRLHVHDHLAHPEVGAVGGGIIHRFPREGKFTKLLVGDNEIRYSVSSPMRYQSPIPTCNASFKRSVLAEIGLFDETLHVGEDTEICHRLGMHGYKILFDPRASIIHESSEGYWTTSDIHRLGTDFIRGGRVWFGIEKAQPKQKYRLPRNTFLVLGLFFPILLIRELKFLNKLKYMMSVKTLRQIPYTVFGSFFWALGYFKEAWQERVRDRSANKLQPRKTGKEKTDGKQTT